MMPKGWSFLVSLCEVIWERMSGHKKAYLDAVGVVHRSALWL